MNDVSHVVALDVFRRRSPCASGSTSIAQTRDAPSLAAAMESTALPEPRSATVIPSRIASWSMSTAPRVDAWSPVPKAMPGIDDDRAGGIQVPGQPGRRDRQAA